MILIQAKQLQGFHRCGVFHPFLQVAHPDDAFTAEQLATLQAEPILSVVIKPDAEESEPLSKPKPEK